jgi:hypothetical protein
MKEQHFDIWVVMEAPVGDQLEPKRLEALIGHGQRLEFDADG